MGKYKKKLYPIFLILIIVATIFLFVNGISGDEMTTWSKTQIKHATMGDLLILVIIGTILLKIKD